TAVSYAIIGARILCFLLCVSLFYFLFVTQWQGLAKRQRKSAEPSRLRGTSLAKNASQMPLSHWVMLVFLRVSIKTFSTLCFFCGVGFFVSRPLTSFSQNVLRGHTKKGGDSDDNIINRDCNSDSSRTSPVLANIRCFGE